MRTIIARQRIATSAVLAASLAVLAACGPKNAAGEQSGTPSPVADPEPSLAPVTSGIVYAAGAVLISNGRKTVLVAGQEIAFATTVTDATWSPDGSRIAFVDGDGNISTARPDGSDRRVLTKKRAGVTRSRPTWHDQEIKFAERDSKGSRVMAVPASGYQTISLDPVGDEYDAYLGSGDTEKDNSSPSASATETRDYGVGELAYEHRGAKGPEVWVVDGNQREPYSSKKAVGSEPALSPDGSKVAYVAPNGQVKVTTMTGKTVQVSFGAAAPTHLVWTPDGKRVAYTAKNGIESVAATVAAGATSNPAQQIAASPGVVTFLAPARDRISRFTGKDPIDVAVAASRNAYVRQKRYCQCEGSQAKGAVLVATLDPAYALRMGGSLRTGNGPVLFTGPDSLDPRTAAELKRIFGTVGQHGSPTVRIVGGTDLVSASAEQALRKLGYTTERTVAADLYAGAVTGRGGGEVDLVLVVSAKDPALVSAALSATSQVVYTDGKTLPAATRTFLGTLPPSAKIYAVGADAQAALAPAWPGKHNTVVSLVGANASATSALLAQAFAGSPDRVVVVKAGSSAEAITAVGLGAPIILTGTDGRLDPVARRWLEDVAPAVDRTMIVASEQDINAANAGAIGALVSGPLGYASSINPAYRS